MVKEKYSIAYLKRKARRLQKARDRQSQLDVEYRESMGEWEEKNKKLVSRRGRISRKVAEKEDELRQLTVKVFEKTGNREPAPGLGIREIGSFEVTDDEEILRWCIEHKLFLQANLVEIRAFSKLWITEIPGIEVGTALTASLSTNFHRQLDKEKD